MSSARVFAPFMVASVCSSSKLVGLFSFMNVMVPAFSALIASIVFGLNATVSTPVPVGSVVMIVEGPFSERIGTCTAINATGAAHYSGLSRRSRRSRRWRLEPMIAEAKDVTVLLSLFGAEREIRFRRASVRVVC